VGEVAQGVRTDDARVEFGELLRLYAAPSVASVRLPSATARDIGRHCSIYVEPGSQTVTLIAPPQATIDGALTRVILAGLNICVLVKPLTWAVIGPVSIPAATVTEVTPLWEWNGTDLTQFGALELGSKAQSDCAVSVVSALGVNWIEFFYHGVGSGANDGKLMAVLPILASSFGTPDYRIEAECYISTLTTGFMIWEGFGLVARFDPTGSTTPGTGYEFDMHTHTGNARVIGKITSTDRTKLKDTDGEPGLHDHNTTDMSKIWLEVNGPCISGAQGGCVIGAVDDTHTAEGQAGLLCAQVNCPSGGDTHTMRFRNIKVWAV